jgi:hypothetical protein
MGSWNGTCAISNLHITSGTPVVVFMLAKNNAEKTFCYGNALYELCPIPFYGKYNDYGAVEDCHGFGLNIVVESIREKLYKFGQGPNSSHDCEVTKENFDIEMLFEADHEDRLGIEHHSSWDSDEYQKRELEKMSDEKGLSESQQFELDRLASKIKKVDNFRAVTHVQIHGTVFNDIMNKWYIEEYVGDSKGNKGYNNNYNHLYFKDMMATLPDYIAKKKDVYALDGSSDEKLNRMLRRFGADSDFAYGDPCHAGRWIQSASRNGGEGSSFAIIAINEIISDYCEAGDWDSLEKFATELLVGLWINSFMSHSRKIWTKQCGAGSQNNEPLPYEILANSVLGVLVAEKAERDSWDDDDEVDDTVELVVDTTEYKDYIGAA